MTGVTLLGMARVELFRTLLDGTLTSSEGVVSIADRANSLSRAVSVAFYENIRRTTAEAAGASEDQTKAAGQRAGNQFEMAIVSFLEETLPMMSAIRPGTWRVTNANAGLSREVTRQYAHLASLADLVQAQPELLAMLGNDYLIKPDVVVLRHPVSEQDINRSGLVVDDTVAQLADIRDGEAALPLLHASVSCKWTLRSDRAQNARSEALNLLRNRKGRAPHIAVVTAEPVPSRIASIALGTGDIDCVYHLGLSELQSAVATVGHSDSIRLLETMVQGRRLKDIADLPLDLAV